MTRNLVSQADVRLTATTLDPKLEGVSISEGVHQDTILVYTKVDLLVGNISFKAQSMLVSCYTQLHNCTIGETSEVDKLLEYVDRCSHKLLSVNILHYHQRSTLQSATVHLLQTYITARHKSLNVLAVTENLAFSHFCLLR